MDRGTGCLICNKELVYSDENNLHTCFYCQTTINSNVTCPDQHFVCDNCHSKDANELVLAYCEQSISTNPIGMANSIMKSPKVKMHGPEHHFLVAAVLITAHCNAKNNPAKKTMLLQAKERAGKVPGGFCGTHGNCGAGVATGIYASVITGASPLSGMPWKHSNMLTAISLLKIAEQGGPRCCKRDSFIALQQAIDYASKNFGVEFTASGTITCEFYKSNRQCTGIKCRYFPKSSE